MKKNMKERTKLIEAMEYVARQINDETVFDKWLVCGVEDGCIEYGDFDWGNPEAQWYADDDETFADIMDTFLKVMHDAYKSGGLYCNGIVSKSR